MIISVDVGKKKTLKTKYPVTLPDKSQGEPIDGRITPQYNEVCIWHIYSKLTKWAEPQSTPDGIKNKARVSALSTSLRYNA